MKGAESHSPKNSNDDVGSEHHIYDRRSAKVPVAMERRSQVRRRLRRITVTIWAEETSSDGVYFRRIKNISQGGLAIAVDSYLRLEKIVALKFILPGGNEPVVVRGKIVGNEERQRRYWANIQFIDIVGDGYQRLRAFIAQESNENGEQRRDSVESSGEPASAPATNDR